MLGLAQLEAHTTKLVALVKTLTDYCEHVEAPADFTVGKVPQPLLPPQAPSEAQRARLSIVAIVTQLQTLLNEPAEFLQQIGRQNQLLACLQWLGEFQVLACIPLEDSVAFKDVADLTGVPEMQLCRIVRMTVTAGFLREPEPGHVAHSALSAPFVTSPTLLDAAMFLSETMAPAALQMAVATQHYENLQRSKETASNVAFITPATFTSAYEQRPKLRRQWSAYLQHVTDDPYASVMDVLTCLDWHSLGNATVVECGAQSTATAIELASLYPSLRLIVQMSDAKANGHSARQSGSSDSLFPVTSSNGRFSTLSPRLSATPVQLNSRIEVQRRTPGTPQRVEGAAVYIFGLPSPSPTMPTSAVRARIVGELRVHISVLRANLGATLVLITRLLPEPGSVDTGVETLARLRDLSLLQLTNEREIDLSDLTDMIHSVRDSTGRLVLVNKIRSPHNATVAFEVRFQAYAGRHELGTCLIDV